MLYTQLRRPATPCNTLCLAIFLNSGQNLSKKCKRKASLLMRPLWIFIITTSSHLTIILASNFEARIWPYSWYLRSFDMYILILIRHLHLHLTMRPEFDHYLRIFASENLISQSRIWAIWPSFDHHLESLLSRISSANHESQQFLRFSRHQTTSKPTQGKCVRSLHVCVIAGAYTYYTTTP